MIGLRNPFAQRLGDRQQFFLVFFRDCRLRDLRPVIPIIFIYYEQKYNSLRDPLETDLLRAKKDSKNTRGDKSTLSEVAINFESVHALSPGSFR